MKRILPYLKPHKKTLFLALILAAINQIFSLLDPQVWRLLIDNYAVRAMELTWVEFSQGVGLLLLVYVGVAFISRTAKTFQEYYVSVIEQNMGTDLYNKAVRHAFSLPFGIFEDRQSGEILRKLQKAREDAQLYIRNLVNVVFLFSISLIIVISYAFYVHWLIGSVYIIIIPVMGITLAYLSRRIKTAQREIVQEQGELAGSTTETLRNVELVKSLGLENQEVDRLNNANKKILGLELKKVKYVRMLIFIQGTMVNGFRAGIMGVLLYLIFNGHVSVGEFFTLLFYSFAVFVPLQNLGDVVTSWQQANASLEKLDEILSIKPRKTPKSAKEIDTVKNIKLDKLTFEYAGAKRKALDNVSIDIKAGQTIALAGASGSGKSTIVKLLTGLYDPNKGALKFNGVKSTDIDFNALRKKIGLVTQDTQLFAGTVRENLLFVNPDASDEDCMEALEQANIEYIVTRNKEGLDTKIGESGIKLSGGEKQRLSIARALLRKPEILIFDEATSALDSVSEQAITKTIKSIKDSHPELICVLVAHRLSTIMHADNIFVLDQGVLKEQGTHNQLIAENGLYATYWSQQTS